MRMLMHVDLSVEPFNSMMRDGTAGETRWTDDTRRDLRSGSIRDPNVDRAPSLAGCPLL